MPGREQNHEQGKRIAHAQELRERLQGGALSELQSYPQWVVWKRELMKGQAKKPPYNPRTGRLANPTDPTTWAPLDLALRRLESGHYDGLGFVFSPRDPFTGTDLDYCIDQSGQIAPWAKKIVTTLDSYTEYSPSQNGLHILTLATLPGPGRKVGQLEMYSTNRFFTMSLNHLEGTPLPISDRQQAQEYLYASLLTETHPHPARESTRGGVLGRRDYPDAPPLDEEVLQKALTARNGSRFERLWKGDTVGFKSKSEADFTLALYLLYWTNDDITQTRRLFHQSGLYDPDKTERDTGGHSYLDVTIYNALKLRNRPPRR